MIIDLPHKKKSESFISWTFFYFVYKILSKFVSEIS